ncbi:hypothetical protein Tco_1426676, partial [Tanacetum coccineum]
MVAPGGGDEDEEMPQAMSPPPRTQGERISQLEKVLHGMHEVLHCQREVLDSMARDFIRFTTWTVTSLSRMMDRAGPRCREIDDVGEVSIIWKSRSVGVLKSQDGCLTHILAHKLNLENLASKIS